MYAADAEYHAQQAMLAQRWRMTTERLVEARHRFQSLNDADTIDINAMRRVARLIHDLERERGALGREMEQLEQSLRLASRISSR